MNHTMNLFILTKQAIKPHFMRTICARTPIRDIKDILPMYITDKKANWEGLRKEMLTLNPRTITLTNVDFVVIGCFQYPPNCELALDYVDYLHQNGHELNLAATSRLLQIYATLNESPSSKTYDFESLIIQSYNDLQQKCKVFDSTLTESLIKALSTTHQWKDCLSLFSQLKLSSKPTTNTYSALICALFKGNETHIAWQHLQELFDIERKPPNACYLSYLQLISSDKDWPTFQRKLEVLFEFWSNNDVLIAPNVAERVVELLKRFEKPALLSRINLKGECAKCKSQLPATMFNEDDFERLKKEFFDRVIVGKDVFRKSTPKELDAFRRFLECSDRFDVIIDGLNVAFSSGTHRGQEFASSLVAKVTRYYAAKNKRVLVLGRNHMKRWPHIAEIERIAKLFLTQNISQDDPYLLYCALNSGQGTIIVSRDLMRGHLYLLKEPGMKQLFKRWLSLTQHKLIYAYENGNVAIEASPAYIVSAQKHGNVWHLPCAAVGNDIHRTQSSRGIKQTPILWLCVQL